MSMFVQSLFIVVQELSRAKPMLLVKKAEKEKRAMNIVKVPTVHRGLGAAEGLLKLWEIGLQTLKSPVAPS